MDIGEDGEDLREKIKITVESESKEEIEKTGKDNSSENAVVKASSLSVVGSFACRICISVGKERLLSPCHCMGSLAYVHLSCLERWLNQAARSDCELCGFRFPTTQRPRFNRAEAMRRWFSDPSTRSLLQADCLIFTLLTMLAISMVVLCVLGTKYFLQDGTRAGIPYKIIEVFMIFIAAMVLSAYLFSAHLLWKYHYMVWRRFRRANVDVRLIT